MIRSPWGLCHAIPHQRLPQSSWPWAGLHVGPARRRAGDAQGRGCHKDAHFFFLLWHPLSDGVERQDSEAPQLVLDSDPEGPWFNSRFVQYFWLRFFGLFCVCMLPPGLCLASFFLLVWFMSACYPQQLPTAIGYPPTAIIGRIGHSEFFLFYYGTFWPRGMMVHTPNCHAKLQEPISTIGTRTRCCGTRRGE